LGCSRAALASAGAERRTRQRNLLPAAEKVVTLTDKLVPLLVRCALRNRRIDPTENEKGPRLQGFPRSG
jgi:hypothetical protein